MSPDRNTTLAVLREAVERADVLASTLERLVRTQEGVIEIQRQRIAELQSQLAEWKCVR
jgi:hypothetical protein